MAADPTDPNNPTDQDDSANQGMNLEDLSGETTDVTASPNPDMDDEMDDMSDKFATDLASVFDVNVNVAAVLGKTEMDVSQLLKLGRGAIIELDRKVGEAIEIYVNSRLIARGEIVVVEDQLGITMTEIVKGGLL